MASLSILFLASLSLPNLQLDVQQRSPELRGPDLEAQEDRRADGQPGLRRRRRSLRESGQSSKR